MEQGMIVSSTRLPRAAVLLFCLAIVSGCAPGNEKPSMTPSTTNMSPNPASESMALAGRIQSLDELPLPDEWYPAKGATVAERFEAAATAMRAKDPKAPSGRVLMARFENGGKPFKHGIWFNRPLRCAQCTQGGGDGYLTIVSVARGQSVTITAGELHAVVAHGGAFPPEKLALLKLILGPG
jgi:hypothetical protein